MSGAEYLASIYGTEKDKVCAFLNELNVASEHVNNH